MLTNEFSLATLQATLSNASRHMNTRKTLTGVQQSDSYDITAMFIDNPIVVRNLLRWFCCDALASILHTAHQNSFSFFICPADWFSVTTR